MMVGWWLLPTDQRTEDIFEREMRRLVDDAMHEFKEDRDRFLSPGDSFSDPTTLAQARRLILKIGQDRFGIPTNGFANLSLRLRKVSRCVSSREGTLRLELGRIDGRGMNGIKG